MPSTAWWAADHTAPRGATGLARRLHAAWLAWLPMLLATVAGTMLTGCDEAMTESPVPAVYISYSCNVTTINAAMQQTHQTQLDCPGGYVTVSDVQTLSATDAIGTGGLLLVHAFEGGSTFYAFDLACPQCYQAGGSASQRLSRIQMADDGMTARCSRCESEFGAIFWGSPAPTAGPANAGNYVLRQYKARLLGDVLTVTK